MKLLVFPFYLKNQKRIGIKCLGYFKNMVRTMRTFEGYKWSEDLRIWHIPFQETSIEKLQKVFDQIVIEVRESPPKSIQQKIEKEKEIPLKNIDQHALLRLEEKLIVKRYSWNTIKVYKNYFPYFSNILRERT